MPTTPILRCMVIIITYAVMSLRIFQINQPKNVWRETATYMIIGLCLPYYSLHSSRSTT